MATPKEHHVCNLRDLEVEVDFQDDTNAEIRMIVLVDVESDGLLSELTSWDSKGASVVKARRKLRADMGVWGSVGDWVDFLPEHRFGDAWHMNDEDPNWKALVAALDDMGDEILRLAYDEIVQNWVF